MLYVVYNFFLYFPYNTWNFLDSSVHYISTNTTNKNDENAEIATSQKFKSVQHAVILPFSDFSSNEWVSTGISYD